MYVYIYINISIYINIYIHIYKYIYRERDDLASLARVLCREPRQESPRQVSVSDLIQFRADTFAFRICQRKLLHIWAKLVIVKQSCRNVYCQMLKEKHIFPDDIFCREP